MSKKHRNRNKGNNKKASKAGLPPGTMVYTGVNRSHAAKIELIEYSETSFDERELSAPELSAHLIGNGNTHWININAVHDTELVESFGAKLNIHPLVLEDIVSVEQRPKIEDFGEYVFFSLRMLQYDQKTNKLAEEQVSFLLGSNYVISFQEVVGDIFEPVRDRIRQGRGRIRRSGADYLVYALVDTVVDSYYHIIDKLGSYVEDLEDQVFENPDESILLDIQENKRMLIKLRKAIYPLREAVNKLQKREIMMVTQETARFFGDVYDHTIQIIESVESYRDINSGLKDIYLSSVSHRMNQIMQVLTVISTIFIPLTFITGVYGMNFHNMPELSWKNGYFMAWTIMLLIVGAMLVYFKSKKWL